MLYVFPLGESDICTVEHIHDILERYYAQALIWRRCLYTERERTHMHVCSLLRAHVNNSDFQCIIFVHLNIHLSDDF